MSKIPANAKKVFDGVIFDVYQWQQKMYDDSFKTFEKVKRPDTVSVFAITPEGKIIMTRQSQPGLSKYIGTLGGRVDEGEDHLTAAKRELLEESGYASNDWHLWFMDEPLDKVDWQIHTYIAKNCKKVTEIHQDPGEKIELIFVSFDEFINDIIYRDNYREFEVIIKIVKAQKNPEELEKLKKLFTL